MTASFLGAEALVDAIVLKLKAEMPTRVLAINAEKNDGITVAIPDNARYFTSAVSLIPPPGPAVLVMDGPMRLNPGGEGPHSLLTQTQIAVWVMDEDQTEQSLARKLQRLNRAVIESLWDGAPKEALAKADGSQLAYSLLPEQTVPGRAFEPEGGGTQLRAFYLTIFSVIRLES